MKQFAIGAFIIITIVQWFVPGKMIWDKEAVLRKGKVFNFRTEPVDPSHPFKGRYIALSFKENEFTTASPIRASSITAMLMCCLRKTGMALRRSKM